MRKKTDGKRIALIVTAGLVLILGIVCGVWLYEDSRVYKTCRVEAGVEVSASDFMKNGSSDAVFTENSGAFSGSEPGEYHLRLKSGLFSHSVTLIIEDTTAPSAEPVKVSLTYGDTCQAEDFVENITDATKVEVSFVETPDFAKAGSQDVSVCLTDMGGNQTTIVSSLTVAPVYAKLTVEAGCGLPQASDFVLLGEECSYVTDVEQNDYSAVGDYEITLLVDGQTYTSVLHVADTIAPQVEVRDVEGFTMTELQVSDFIVEINDATEVTAEFEQEPDLSVAGTQELVIIFTDGGGNEVAKEVKLTLTEDTEPPVINGVGNLTVYIGDGISYRKNVTVTDNSGEEPELEIDTSAVNLSAEGTYPVIYRAVDGAGNETSVTVTVTVRKKEYTQEALDALADSVLAQILTDDMTAYDKVWAIYSYVNKHISYVDSGQKDDWIQAAYDGISSGKGDCYTYACATKALLNRAGITNMDIAKIPTQTSSHYWNLVDIGDGWYHLDTCPRKDHPTIFMWTDEELMAYSEAHDLSHNYDHSLYPEVN